MKSTIPIICGVVLFMLAGRIPALHARETTYLVEPVHYSSSQSDIIDSCANDGKWGIRTGQFFVNRTFDRMLLADDGESAPALAVRYPVPRGTYRIYALYYSLGSYEIRLPGGDWQVTTGGISTGYGARMLVGEQTDTDTIRAEVRQRGTSQARYMGLWVVSDDKPTVVPMERFYAKMRNREKVSILLLGDSVTESEAPTYGGANSDDACWRGLLRDTLVTAYCGGDVSKLFYCHPRYDFVYADPDAQITLVNLGIGGDTAPGGLQRTTRHMLEHRPNSTDGDPYPCVGYFDPDLVVVTYGVNDCGSQSYTAAEYQLFTEQTANMINNDYGCPVILQTPHWWEDDWCDGGQAVMVDSLKALCAHNGYHLSNSYDVMKGAGDGHGIHPGPTGHKTMFNVLWDTFLDESLVGADTTTAVTGRIRPAGDTRMLVDVNGGRIGFTYRGTGTAGVVLYGQGGERMYSVTCRAGKRKVCSADGFARGVYYYTAAPDNGTIMYGKVVMFE